MDKVTEAEIHLADGRRVTYSRLGIAGAAPVLYCHGSPSSRFEPLSLGDERIATLDLDLVAPDRPGIGGSDPAPVSFARWTKDAIQLADHLGWEKFSVIGNSGGTGFAAACTALHPDRVSSLTLISSAWRMDSSEARSGLKGIYGMVQVLAKRAPWLLRIMFKSMANAKASASDEARMAKFLAPPDFECMQTGNGAEIAQRSMAEALRQGPRAAVDEMRLYLREWDFNLDAIKCPVHLLHGEIDRNAPVAMARALASRLPGASLTVYPGEAHLSTLVRHFDDAAVRVLESRAA